MTNDKDSAVTQADVDAYWDMMDCDGHPPDASSEGFEPCMGMIAFADHRLAQSDALRAALEAAPLIGATESAESFKARQDAWLNGQYRAALQEQSKCQ